MVDLTILALGQTMRCSRLGWLTVNCQTCRRMQSWSRFPVPWFAWRGWVRRLNISDRKTFGQIFDSRPFGNEIRMLKYSTTIFYGRNDKIISWSNHWCRHLHSCFWHFILSSLEVSQTFGSLSSVLWKYPKLSTLYPQFSGSIPNFRHFILSSLEVSQTFGTLSSVLWKYPQISAVYPQFSGSIPNFGTLSSVLWKYPKFRHFILSSLKVSQTFGTLSSVLWKYIRLSACG
jgi:hypothetical protein